MKSRNPYKSILQRTDGFSFSGMVFGILLVILYLTETIVLLAWVLRCLEISSVFDRFLPNYSGWQLLALLVVVEAMGGMLTALIKKFMTRTIVTTTPWD